MTSSLSWLIYFTDICGTVSFSFGFLIALSLVAAIVLTAIRIGFFFEHASDKNIGEAAIVYQKSLRTYSIVAWVAFAYFIAMQVIIPSKQAAVLITASEVNRVVLANLKSHAEGADAADQQALGSSLTLLETWMNDETITIQKHIDAQASSQPDHH